MADITGYVIETSKESEAVLLGSAILAAGAIFGSIDKAAAAMCSVGSAIKPNIKVKGFHDKKYQVFLEMFNSQQKYKNIMEQ